MDDNTYEVALPRPISTHAKPVESVSKQTSWSSCERSREGALVKVTTVLSAILLVLFITTILLHLHQVSEWKEDFNIIAHQLEYISNVSQKNKANIDHVSKQGRNFTVIAHQLEYISNVSQKNKANIDHISKQGRKYHEVGSSMNPASSCDIIQRMNSTATNGLYYIKDIDGLIFETYCDMSIAGGGWTLVASIHENNMKGRCTAGDRWSSEQGNSAAHPHGDGFWENRATHGEATSATSDDYKNSGYFAMNASDIMIWVVPNDTPKKSFASKAFFKFRTTSGFMESYGGNLKTLYSDHFPMRSKQFRRNLDNGPAIPIVWDTGSNEELLQLLDPNVQGEVNAGFVQFRTINNENNAFAFCPGLRIKPGMVNVAHACIGSTSNNLGGHAAEYQYCGDFTGRDWLEWSSDQKLIDSVVMIFYK